MPHPPHMLSDTEADEAHDMHAPAVQHGVDARLSGERSRVRIPFGAPSDFVQRLALPGEEIPEFTMHVASTIPPLSKAQRVWAEGIAAAR